jgi:SSS family transporter
MLHAIDIGIIIVYLALTVAIGIIFRGRQESANDYFTASGHMGGIILSIMVGLSIAATLFSGITFVGYTGIVINEGIGILLGLIAYPISLAVLYFWFIPAYLSKNPSGPYEVVEMRFGKKVRLLTSAMYILARIGWMGALIYAPTIALMSAAGLSDAWFWPIILTIGLSSTLYTVLGGIRGVVITDAIQFMLIAVGIVVAVIFIISNVPVGMGEMFNMLREKGKLNLFDWRIDMTKSINAWSMLIAYSSAMLAGYLSDQMCLQRYIATGNAKSAVRSLKISIIGSFIVVVLLSAVGILLISWYHFNPDPNLPENADKIFAYFVANHLPVGIAGLILAALLAATMSSMTSGINTLASTVTLDFRLRVGKEMNHKQQLRFAKITSFIIGVAATITAGLVQHLGLVWEINMAMGGMFGGTILLVVILSLLKQRYNVKIVFSGMIVCAAVGVTIVYLPWANIWALPISVASAMLFIYFGSMIVNSNNNKLTE